MTRFARAKGSKASNERMPNEATPWHVMKEQLEERKAMRNSSSLMKSKSAKELLDETDQPFYSNSIGNVKNDWAEFEVANKTTGMSAKKIKCEASIENPQSEKIQEAIKRNSVHFPELRKNNNASSCRNSGKIWKKQNSVSQAFSENNNNNKSSASGESEKTNEKNETTEKQKNNSTDEKIQKKSVLLEKLNEKVFPCPSKNNGKISKRQKRNQKRLNKRVGLKAVSSELKHESKTNFNVTGNDWCSNIYFGKDNTNLKAQDNEMKNEERMGIRGSKNSKSYNQNVVKRKAPKIRDDKEHKRRKAEVGSIKYIINGVEVEIIKYDGFPVKKEDAERLKGLRQTMVMKGIPKSEIDAAIKLERRKAEKSLARVRKQVCFHCRKAGHNLSDCPELGHEESVTGICFKCGSTEHTHFECKVTKKEVFRFASCFICREQGHIAKQCPDNPKGLYPQGGACKICGDVTHLKKDCPELTKEKEEFTLTVGKITENTLELLEEGPKILNKNNKLKNNVIKF